MSHPHNTDYNMHQSQSHWHQESSGPNHYLPPVSNLLSHEANPYSYEPQNMPMMGAHSAYPPPPSQYPASSSRLRVEDVPQHVLATPLPPDDEDDFPTPLQVIQGLAKPAVKAGGARHAVPSSRSKGKQRAVSPVAKADAKAGGKRKATMAASSQDTKKQKGEGRASGASNYTGRMTGSSNYTQVDVEALCDITEEILPLAGKGWENVSQHHKVWALENERPIRTAKSLEAKFKQLVKTKKPTGDAEVPEHVRRAWEIEDLINEKAGTQDLDDDDLAEGSDDPVSVSSGAEDSDSEKENRDPNVKKAGRTSKVKAERKVKAEPKESTLRPVVGRAGNERLQVPGSTRGRANQDFMSNLTRALDPAAHAARAEERETRSLQTAHIFTLTSQLRESQTLVENFRVQLTAAERRCSDAERRADRAEMMLLIERNRRIDSSPGPSHTPSRRSRPLRHDVYYAGGGQSTFWLNPDDSPFDTSNLSPGTRVHTRYDSRSPTPAPSSRLPVRTSASSSSLTQSPTSSHPTPFPSDVSVEPST